MGFGRNLAQAEAIHFDESSTPKVCYLKHRTTPIALAARRFQSKITAQGPIAQRLEQATHNRLVTGSNPVGPTTPKA